MKQTQTKPPNQTAGTKTTNPPPPDNKLKTFSSFQDHFVLAVPHSIVRSEQIHWMKLMSWRRSRHSAQLNGDTNLFYTAEGCGVEPWQFVQSWVWKAADTPAFCVLCPVGFSALCHQMVNFCCEWVWWKENSVLHEHLHSHLTAKCVPRKGEGLEGEAFTKAGEMGDGSTAWNTGLTLVNKCFLIVDFLLGLLCWLKMCWSGLMDHRID